MLKIVFVPINRAGWPFIGLFAAASLGLAYVAPPAGWIGALLTAWCIYFFREPDRVTPTRQGLIVSPARRCPATPARRILPKRREKAITRTILL